MGGGGGGEAMKSWLLLKHKSTCKTVLTVCYSQWLVKRVTYIAAGFHDFFQYKMLQNTLKKINFF